MYKVPLVFGEAQSEIIDIMIVKMMRLSMKMIKNLICLELGHYV